MTPTVGVSSNRCFNADTIELIRAVRRPFPSPGSPVDPTLLHRRLSVVSAVVSIEFGVRGPQMDSVEQHAEHAALDLAYLLHGAPKDAERDGAGLDDQDHAVTDCRHAERI